MKMRICCFSALLFLLVFVCACSKQSQPTDNLRAAAAPSPAQPTASVATATPVSTPLPKVPPAALPSPPAGSIPVPLPEEQKIPNRVLIPQTAVPLPATYENSYVKPYLTGDGHRYLYIQPLIMIDGMPPIQAPEYMIVYDHTTKIDKVTSFASQPFKVDQIEYWGPNGTFSVWQGDVVRKFYLQNHALRQGADNSIEYTSGQRGFVKLAEDRYELVLDSNPLIAEAMGAAQDLMKEYAAFLKKPSDEAARGYEKALLPVHALFAKRKSFDKKWIVPYDDGPLPQIKPAPMPKTQPRKDITADA